MYNAKAVGQQRPATRPPRASVIDAIDEMGCCGSKRFDAYNWIEQLRRGGCDDACLEEVKPGFFDPAKRDKAKRSPFEEACRLNKLLILKCIWSETSMQRKVTQELKDLGLIAACGGATNHRVVRFLVEVVGASPTAVGEGECSPLHLLCRKSRGGLGPDTTPQILAHRRVAANLLITKGADLEKEDLDGKTPLTTCCFYKHLKMAMIIAERGGMLHKLTTWMNRSELNAKNWVAGAVMTKYAWKSDSEFKDVLKTKFFEEFDKDGSGELDDAEFLHFMAFNMKLAFKRGPSRFCRGLLSFGRPAFHSRGPDFHSRVLRCRSMTG